MTPPWEADDPDKAVREYIARAFHGADRCACCRCTTARSTSATTR